MFVLAAVRSRVDANKVFDLAKNVQTDLQTRPLKLKHWSGLVVS